jgi:DNA polymerase III sliding clamp (beta) subunit (PCNA family)
MEKNSPKRNFKLKMHMTCGKDDLRPIMSHVYFDNGNMVSTDAHVLIKAKTSEFTDFDPSELEILNGKFIHANTFKKILACKHVVVEEEGVKDLASGDVYKFAKVDGKYPNYEAVLPQGTLEIDQIGVAPKVIKQIFSVLTNDLMQTVALKFSGKNKAIKITSTTLNDSDFTAIVMPCALFN